MRKMFYPLLLTLLLSLALPVASAQELVPSLRLVSVEGMRNLSITLRNGTVIQVVQVNYTFALTSVEAWADRVNCRFWLGEQEVASWWTGFSVGPPPQLQGLGGSGGYLWCEVLMAEFPYGSTTIEGRTYYQYRVHVYYLAKVFAKETAYFGAAYMVEPTLQGSSLLRLKVKSIGADGVASFKDKLVHED